MDGDLVDVEKILSIRSGVHLDEDVRASPVHFTSDLPLSEVFPFLSPSLRDGLQRLCQTKCSTVEELLFLSTEEMIDYGNLSEKQTEDLLRVVDGLLKASLPPLVTAWTFCQDPLHHKYVSFGCPILDKAFGGGIQRGHITELVGESASGKTQLALQLLLHTSISPDIRDTNPRAVYISTESVPFRRMVQMAEEFENRYRTGIPVMDRVIIQPASSVEEPACSFGKCQVNCH